MPKLLEDSPSSYKSKALSPSTSQKGKGTLPASSSSTQGFQIVTRTPRAINITPSKAMAKSSKKTNYYAPPPGEKAKFITKPFTIPITPLEEQYIPPNISLLQIVGKVFLPGTYLVNTDPNRSRSFYEFILVDTDSIVLTHIRDNDTSTIKYSKFKINRVLSPADWGTHPAQTKEFTREFLPQNYNYFDYMNAWTDFLTIRPYEHTWFIWFNKNISLHFPNWFIKWFEVYGVDPTVFSNLALEALEDFELRTACPNHKSLIAFTAVFGITLIMSWSLTTEPIWPKASALQLSRTISIKWWDAFNPDLLSSEVREAWYKKNPKLCKNIVVKAENSEFLAEKSRLLASLAAITNPAQFAEKLQEVTSSLSDNASQTSSPNLPDLDPSNEDDCYGIFD